MSLLKHSEKTSMGRLHVDKLNRMLQAVAEDFRKQASVEGDRHHISLRPGKDSVEVEFVNGRKQRITFERVEDRYVMTSVILEKKAVKAEGLTTLLPFIWACNRETNVVAFSVGERGRLIGRIQELTSTLDPPELAYYVETLARECDYLEYYLSGLDVY